MVRHGTGAGWQVRRIPAARVPQIEMMPALALRNPMEGLLEVDVSRARQLLRAQRERTGETWSFTAFVIACVARAVAEQPQVQAFRRGRRLLVFEQVDVATMVEVTIDGERVPLPYVIRDAGNRSVPELHRTLRSVQGDPAAHATDNRRQVGRLLRLPRPLRWLLWQILARSPRLWQRHGGTVTVTSVGMFGSGRAWGHGLACYPVTVTVGGISEQLHLVDGRPEVHEHLHLTVSLDHDAVDGGPAARFLHRLRELLETGQGLEAGPTDDDPAVPAATVGSADRSTIDGP